MKGDQGCHQACPPGIYRCLLHAGVEVAGEAHVGAWHLPDQGPAPSWDGRLVGQGSGGLGLAVRLVGVQELQSRLGAKPAEQAVNAPLQCGQARPQDPEDGTILVISFHKFCVCNLFIMLDFVL